MNLLFQIVFKVQFRQKLHLIGIVIEKLIRLGQNIKKIWFTWTETKKCEYQKVENH
jgi:hypothetical protein